MGFEPVSLTDTTDTVNVLYYGDGGTGKTSNLATLANLGPVLVINAEAGLKKRPLANLGINVDNIDIYPDPDDPQGVTFDGLRSVHDYLRANPDAYIGVQWDSLTEIYQKLLRDVVDQAVAKAERIGKSRDPFFVEMQDYGVMTQQVKQLVRDFRDLPIHFGISALERRDQDDDGTVTYGPAASPALVTDVFGYMDIVLHTSVTDVAGKPEYIGASAPYGKYRAKDRFGALPEKMITPSYERIIAYVEGEMTKDSDPLVKAARDRKTKSEPKAA